MTRLPTPRWTPHGSADLGASAALFPLVGVLVGGAAAGIVWVLRSLLQFPATVGAIGAVATSILLTGFLHEDGLADVCDGVGGATAEKRREIMRDSRIGAFGATGLAVVVGSELSLLGSMSVERAILALISAHALGRFASVFLIRIGRQASGDASLAEPYLEGVDNRVLAVSALTALSVLILSSTPLWGLGMAVASIVVVVGSNGLFRRMFGGITGDCLGAVIKVVQIMTLCALAHPNFPTPFWR